MGILVLDEPFKRTCEKCGFYFSMFTVSNTIKKQFVQQECEIQWSIAHNNCKPRVRTRK